MSDRHVRCTRIEVVRLWGDDKGRRQFWLELSDLCKEMTNILWDEWSIWHRQHGSRQKLREFFDQWKRWKNKELKEKPTCDVNAVSPELQRQFGATLAEEFADRAHSRVRTLIINHFVQTIKKRKAAKGSIAGWQAILFGREGRPNFCRHQPIPFDKQNCPNKSPLIKPDAECKNYRLQVRLDRLVEDGKAGSTIDIVELLTYTRRMRSQTAILNRIESGLYDFKGSKLFYDERQRKWFVLISYQMPKTPAVGLDENLVLKIWPARDRPWRTRCGMQYVRFGGRGRHIGPIRRKIRGARRARQDNYRFSSSAGKGHGRGKAIGRWKFQLNRAWRDAVKSYNNNVTGDVIKYCLDRGIGRIVYLQPAEGKQATRFLACSGAEQSDWAGWDFFQFGTMLSNKADMHGIKVEIRKCAGKSAAKGRRKDSSA